MLASCGVKEAAHGVELAEVKSENVHVKSVREFGGWKNVTRQLQAAQITGPSRQFYNKRLPPIKPRTYMDSLSALTKDLN